MTVTKEIHITCDEIGCLAKQSYLNQTIFNARSDAKKSSWAFQGGRDWCPDHAKRK
jgi:hypothetical protein